MFDFTKIFGIEDPDSAKEYGKLFSELNVVLEGYSDEDVVFITGLSGLLGKVAFSDGEISKEEIDEIFKVLSKNCSLNEKLYQAVLSILQSHVPELLGIEDYRYLRIINDNCSRQQKLELLENLYLVAAANESISSDEDNSVAIISKGLKLTNDEFIEVRLKFKDKLDSLKL